MIRPLYHDRSKFVVSFIDPYLFWLWLNHIGDTGLATNVALWLFLLNEMLFSRIILSWNFIGQGSFCLFFLYERRVILVIFRLSIVEVYKFKPG